MEHQESLTFCHIILRKQSFSVLELKFILTLLGFTFPLFPLGEKRNNFFFVRTLLHQTTWLALIKIELWKILASREIPIFISNISCDKLEIKRIKGPQ
jgi:hypothetical protein